MRASEARFGKVMAAIAVGIVASSAAAGVWLPVPPNGGTVSQGPRVEVDACWARGVDVAVDITGLDISLTSSAGGDFVLVTLPGESLSGALGEPALPVVRRRFAAPAGAGVELQVTAGPASTIDLAAMGLAAPIMPMQAPISMAPGELEGAEFHYRPEVYAAGGMTPTIRATATELGVARGQRLFLLEVCPVAYDPVGAAITVWPHIEVNVRFSGGTAGDGNLRPAAWLNSALLNPQPLAAGGRDAENYLIVVAEAYASMAPMTQLVNAKVAEGFNVTTYSVPPGSTAVDIKTYIESQWDSASPPDYLLLVGDSDTIPAWTGAGDRTSPTDLPYACMDEGDDWYPDIALGRFPVRSEAHLQAIVDKTLYVSAGNFDDPEYVRRAAFIAGPDDDCGDEDTHNWVIATHLDPLDYLSNKLYERTYGASPPGVWAALSDGNTWAVYYGHSGSTGWHSPGMNQANVRALTNDGMYSFMCSFSCNAGNFTLEECFAETWMIEANKAGVAVISTSEFIYSSSPPWLEVAALEKFLFDAIYADNIHQIGRAWQAALMDHLALYGPENPMTRDYFEMFNLLGDPSLAIPMPLGFVVGGEPDSLNVCSPPAEQAVFTVNVVKIGDYTEPVTLSATGLPPGSTTDFSVNGVVAPFVSTMTVSNLSGASPGEYNIDISGQATDMQRVTTVELVLTDSVPETVLLTSPTDGEVDVALSPELIWAPAAQAEDYQLEVALDAEFNGLVYAATVSDTSHTVQDTLGTLAVYYWRVRGLNDCGEGSWSEVYAFTAMDVLVPIAYDMLNGEAGLYTYYDDDYDGEGDNDVPLAPLSGGLGDLTNGVIATEHWNYDPVPYVAWKLIEPTITFHFADPSDVSVVTIYVEDSSSSSTVVAPSSVSISMSGTTLQFPVSDPPGDEPFSVSFTDLGLSGTQIEITLEDDNNPSRYMMLSEVEFNGRPHSGACCIDQACVVMTESECAAADGEYQGVDTDCESNPCATMEPGCLIISEVVDGTESGGCPKWIEITNTGLNDFTFEEGGVIVQMDRSTDVNVDVNLTGLTIAAGESFVINSLQKGDCGGAFNFIYGFPADLEVGGFFGDGNDRYILTDTDDGSNLLDIYGEFGTDGTKTPWQYTEGYSYRQSSCNAGNGGVFVLDEWFYGGVGSLSTGDPTQLLLTLTTPGAHQWDQDCTGSAVPGDLDGDGDVDLGDFDVLYGCLAGPGNSTPPAGCTADDFAAADMQGDSDVDLADFGLFELEFGG